MSETALSFEFIQRYWTLNRVHFVLASSITLECSVAVNGGGVAVKYLNIGLLVSFQIPSKYSYEFVLLTQFVSVLILIDNHSHYHVSFSEVTTTSGGILSLSDNTVYLLLSLLKM
jgi:hypothetical protein